MKIIFRLDYYQTFHYLFDLSLIISAENVIIS